MNEFDVISSRILYDGSYIKLREDVIELKERPVARVVVEIGEAVVVVPLDTLDRIFFVRQYRHPLGKTLLELPAGGVKVGEMPLEAAHRELREEIGYSAGSLESLGGFYTVPGFCDEYLHLFVAKDLSVDPLPADEDENIEVEVMSFGEATKLILSGEIADAKTIAGLVRAKGLTLSDPQIPQR